MPLVPPPKGPNTHTQPPPLSSQALKRRRLLLSASSTTLTLTIPHTHSTVSVHIFHPLSTSPIHIPPPHLQPYIYIHPSPLLNTFLRAGARACACVSSLTVKLAPPLFPHPPNPSFPPPMNNLTKQAGKPPSLTHTFNTPLPPIPYHQGR